MDEGKKTTIGDLLRDVVDGEETVFDVLNGVDDDGTPAKRVTVGRRELQPEPANEPKVARAKARKHVFNDLVAFGEYLKRETTVDSSVVLADVSSRAITAVLDEQDSYDRETVSMEAVTHPLFAPWEKLLSRAVPVVNFALFVMQHRRTVLEPEGRELAHIMSQVKASKAITKHVGVGKKSINGVVVELEIAGEKQGVPVELPETITIMCPIFVGSDPLEIELDVLVTENRDDIVVYLTASAVEEQRIKSFEAMVHDLKQSTGLLIGLGQVQHRSWRVVEG